MKQFHKYAYKVAREEFYPIDRRRISKMLKEVLAEDEGSVYEAGKRIREEYIEAKRKYDNRNAISSIPQIIETSEDSKESLECLKKIRFKLGLSVGAFASYMNCPPCDINYWEKGMKKIPSLTIYKIKARLPKRMSDLLIESHYKYK